MDIEKIIELIQTHWGRYHCNAYDKICKGSSESHDAFFDGICFEHDEILNYVKLYENFEFDEKNSIFFVRGLILHFYLVVEKVSIVMNIFDLKKDEKFNGYYRRNFPHFRIVHKRANFIKHPKYFAFCHHPINFIDELHEVTYPCPEDQRTEIDTKFVLEYYDSDHSKKDGKLRQLLENKSCISVRYPNPHVIAEGLIDEIKKFTDLICENDFFCHILKDKSVINEYFESIE